MTHQDFKTTFLDMMAEVWPKQWAKLPRVILEAWRDTLCRNADRPTLEQCEEAIKKFVSGPKALLLPTISEFMALIQTEAPKWQRPENGKGMTPEERKRVQSKLREFMRNVLGMQLKSDGKQEDEIPW